MITKQSNPGRFVLAIFIVSVLAIFRKAAQSYEFFREGNEYRGKMVAPEATEDFNILARFPHSVCFKQRAFLNFAFIKFEMFNSSANHRRL